MVNLVPKKIICPCVMLMRPIRAGLLAVAAQAQVGFGLEVFGEGGFDLGVERGVDLDIETHAPRKPVRADGVRTGSADFASSELTSEFALKPVRRMVMVPASMLRSKFRSDSGWRPRCAHTFGITHAPCLACACTGKPPDRRRSRRSRRSRSCPRRFRRSSSGWWRGRP